MTVLRNSSI